MSASLAYLCTRPGARFTFHCRPCRHVVFIAPGDLLATYGDEMLFENLKRRVICGKCRMPVDDDFRTFEFSAPQGMGGWSGPRVV